jgi:hypothetical protein
MTTHRVAHLEGWYQVIETNADGAARSIGCFRTEADAQSWLSTYLRTQTGAKVFNVENSEEQVDRGKTSHR